ncbi:hypothetical protein PHYSODRAFT_514074 [Phytophthora sojae]|uniref:Phosphatidate cytidylyltransferase n=1 Tax=Phytophthora sojae (strain P6497) TaxID=1094619 RepID=G4ZRB7_PHYSP|nr:hypothetical protein PHYSODRAFT_514074 [Phytophthora sojae]EGZ13802.1 hypothetical protein PHYSODRAFT_514074 [Phytophthora sojae]|eukprot:XP_009531231.1 hypothetical protein PHYSODRAFT_514074 [Phytophthora sojae]
MAVERGSAAAYCSTVADGGSVIMLRSPPDMQSSPQEDWPYRWSDFFQRNAVQRVISAAILAPAVTVFLWLSPAFATTTVCSFMISTCAYEYACLANRIRLRILTQMEALEGPLNGRSSSRRCGNNTSLNDTQSNRSFSSETDEVLQLDPTPSIESAALFSSAVRTRVTRLPQPDARAVEEERENREIAIVDDELRDQEDRMHRCAVTSLALRYFDGHVRWAAAFVSVPVCALTSAGFLLSIQWVSDFESTEFYTYRWFFAIPTGYVVALCACLTPDWQYAVITLVKYGVFTILTLHSAACPMNELNCNLAIGTSEVFLGGTAIILVFRFASTRGRAEAFISFMLDIVELLYVTGTLSILVAFVDDNHRTLYRKLLIALLYNVWASDTGAYIIGKALAYFHYPYYNPFAAHLSKNKDYEGTLGAIIFGVVTMVVASELLDLPGSYGMKVGFTVLAVVVGMMGDLFESLLKRAAGVKDSGTLIPGHEGVLDRIDTLMFATIVFSRYYALQS